MSEPLPGMRDPTHVLAVALCRADARELDPRRLAPLADASFRKELVGLLQRHAVLGLAAATLTRPPLSRVLAGEARDELRAIASRLRRRAAFWMIERDRVLEVLRRAGIDPVMLKGGGLCTTLYAEPVEREFGDLDLLVSEDGLEPAIAALTAAGYQNPWNERQLKGYRTHHFHYWLAHPRGFVVEIHFGLTAPHAPLRLDAADFLAQSVVHDAGRGNRLRLPRPEHQLLHAVDQAVLGAFNHLVKLVDVDRLIRAHPGLRWDVLESTARRGGLERGLALTLRLTRALFGAPIPAPVLQRLDFGPLTRFHLDILRPIPSLLRQHYLARPAAARLLRAWMVPGRRDRWLHLILGPEDPLRWMWAGRDRPPESGGTRAGGTLRLAKLLAYQTGLYVNGLAASMTPRGRAELRSWAS